MKRKVERFVKLKKVDTPKPESNISDVSADSGVPAETLEGQLAAVAAERDQLLAEKADLSDRMLRARAEFDNARRRAERERSDFLQFAAMDLVKDIPTLIAAYDDTGGVTAAFNRNVLAVVNRELNADFDIDAFEHVAKWNADEERIEMCLRVRSAQEVRIADLNVTVDFADGEEMLTEVSCKFRPEGVGAELEKAGLARTHWWTDRPGDFGLSLAVK